jgi:hypothetical protein
MSDNQLVGTLPASCFTWTALEEQGNMPDRNVVPTGNVLLDTTPTWPQTLVLLDLSNNIDITGPLPDAGGGYEDLAFINLGNTSLFGPVPDSWWRFTALQILNLESTNVSCGLKQATNGSIYCDLPSFLVASTTLLQEQIISTPALPPSPAANSSDDSDDSDDLVVQYQPGVHCRQVSFADYPLSNVKVDQSFLGHTLCTCDTGWFGKDGQCVQCPAECYCKADVVQNCYPILQFGQFSQSVPNAPMPNEAGVIVKFVLSAILPCPLTLQGASLCNPSRKPWPQFYYGQTLGSAGSAL